MKNVIEKWGHGPSIIVAQIRSQPADSISIPDGATIFSLTSFCTFFISLAFQRPSLLHWQNICGFVLGDASVDAVVFQLRPLNGVSVTVT